MFNVVFLRVVLFQKLAVRPFLRLLLAVRSLGGKLTLNLLFGNDL